MGTLYSDTGSWIVRECLAGVTERGQEIHFNCARLFDRRFDDDADRGYFLVQSQLGIVFPGNPHSVRDRAAGQLIFTVLKEK